MSRVAFYTPTLPDGIIKSCPVDDFPVKDKSQYKSNGFPRTDMSILDRFSRSHVSREQIEIIASRLEEIKAQPDNGMSDEEKLRVLRPSWVQTASEYAVYESMVMDVMQERAEALNKAKEQTTTDDLSPADGLQPVTPASPVNAQSMPIPWGSIVSAAGSLLGGGISALGQNASNKAYIAGVDKTNAANLNMMREQNAFNERMWNMNNKYNSPAATRARLLAAGINSSDAITGGQSGAAVQSVAGQPQQAPAQTASPYGVLGQAVGGSVNAYLQQRIADEQLQEMKSKNWRAGVENQTYIQEHMLKLQSKILDLEHQRSLTKQDKQRLKLLKQELATAQKNYSWIDKLNDTSVRSAEADISNKAAQEAETRASTKRLDSESAQRIASMKVEDAVSWYNAHTQRASQESQSSLNASHEDVNEATRKVQLETFREIRQRVNEAKDTQHLRYEMQKIAASVMSGDAAVKQYTAAMMYLELVGKKRMSGAAARRFIQENLGIDVSSINVNVGTVKVK